VAKTANQENTTDPNGDPKRDPKRDSKRDPKNASANIKQQFSDLSTDDQLIVLWRVYEGLDTTAVENPDDNAESDSSVELYDHLKESSKNEQYQFMRDVLSGERNDQTSAYYELSNTNKVALWYRLGEGMSESSVVEVPSDYPLSDQAQEIVSSINAVDFEQKFIIMRDIIKGDRA